MLEIKFKQLLSNKTFIPKISMIILSHSCGYMETPLFYLVFHIAFFLFPQISIFLSYQVILPHQPSNKEWNE